MKNLFYTCSLLTFLVAAPAFADNIPADSKLKAATVYTGRATLTRQAVLEIPAGSHTVIFEGLSASLMPDSLRAEGSAGTKVKFGALSHRLASSAELVSPRERELNDELVKLEDQKRRIDAEKQALTEKKVFLETLSKEAAERTREEISDVNLKPEQWSQAGKTIFNEIGETLKALIDQDIALRTLNEQIQKLQTELSQLQTGQRNTYVVSLPVETNATATLTVELSYQIPGASWTPLYDARLDTKTGKVELVQYGSVQQTSGEDWSDVSLTLSTAQPQRGTGLPDLNPFWLSFYEQESYKAARSNIMTMSASMDVADMAGAAERQVVPAMAPAPVKAEFETAQIETGGFVSEYRIPGPSTVKADGTESKLMIGSFDSDSKMLIQIKPQISTEAYLVAKTTLKGEAPVLPGPVNLFRDGAYVGQNTLPLLRPGEDQDLAFGIDDQISIKRKIMKDERSKAGVISPDQVIERHVLTEIQNLHTLPVELSVLETVPVAQDKKIKTDIIKGETTQGYEEDVYNIKGLLNWTLNMKPKEKSEIKLGWKVSWPADKDLSGL